MPSVWSRGGGLLSLRREESELGMPLRRRLGLLRRGLRSLRALSFVPGLPLRSFFSFFGLLFSRERLWSFGGVRSDAAFVSGVGRCGLSSKVRSLLERTGRPGLFVRRESDMWTILPPRLDQRIGCGRGARQ